MEYIIVGIILICLGSLMGILSQILLYRWYRSFKD